jgi:hypothetical protein
MSAGRGGAHSIGGRSCPSGKTACAAVNGHVQVFYDTLSNVAYTIRVVDTLTEAQEEYADPAGRLASLAGTAAF